LAFCHNVIALLLQSPDFPAAFNLALLNGGA
jgi:hypothetical protein